VAAAEPGAHDSVDLEISNGNFLYYSNFLLQFIIISSMIFPVSSSA
jgi:hypothetical protein